MGIELKLKSVFHKIAVKFSPASLPGMENSFFLKTAHPQVLDIRGVVSKAADYNFNTSPKVMEEGLTSGLALMSYLAADGYVIKTDLFSLRSRVPGVYDSTETQLPPGVYPLPKIKINPAILQYFRDNVKVEFDGKTDTEGNIAHAIDEATGTMDEVMTRGNLLSIRGHGLKLEGDEFHQEQLGVFFKPNNGVPIKASIVAWNSPRLLKVLVPQELTAETEYQIAVETWSSPMGHPGIFKKARDMRSRFRLKAV